MAIELKRVTGCISLLLLLFVAVTAFKCDREKDPEFIIMSFVLPFTVTPSSEELLLGDTLWVEAAFSETLQEFNTKVDYDIKDFDFASKIGLFKLINPNLDLSDQPSATDFFNFVPVTGTLPFVGDTFSPFTFEYKDRKYFFKLGLVPKQKGIFCVNFLGPRELDLRPGLNLTRNNDGRLIIPDFQSIMFIINDGNTNFDLYQQHCKATSTTPPGSLSFINVFYEQKGSFTFEVK